METIPDLEKRLSEDVSKKAAKIALQLKQCVEWYGGLVDEEENRITGTINRFAELGFIDLGKTVVSPRDFYGDTQRAYPLTQKALKLYESLKRSGYYGKQ